MSKITLSMLMLFAFFSAPFSHGQTTTAALFVACEDGMHQPAALVTTNNAFYAGNAARCEGSMAGWLSALDTESGGKKNDAPTARDAAKAFYTYVAHHMDELNHPLNEVLLRALPNVRIKGQHD